MRVICLPGSQGHPGRRRAWMPALILCLLGLLSAPAPATDDDAAEDDEPGYTQRLGEATEARSLFEENHPELRAFFKKSYAYAIYPKVRKLAYALGIASGDGMVFREGEAIGYSRLTQVTYGVTAGAHSFAEVIFFRNAEVFDRFLTGKLKLDAQASAVAGSAAAMADYDFDSDVLVYTLTKKGLMFDLSLGGQKFSFEPL